MSELEIRGLRLLVFNSRIECDMIFLVPLFRAMFSRCVPDFAPEVTKKKHMFDGVCSVNGPMIQGLVIRLILGRSCGKFEDLVGHVVFWEAFFYRP